MDEAKFFSLLWKQMCDHVLAPMKVSAIYLPSCPGISTADNLPLHIRVQVSDLFQRNMTSSNTLSSYPILLISQICFKTARMMTFWQGNFPSSWIISENSIILSKKNYFQLNNGYGDCAKQSVEMRRSLAWQQSSVTSVVNFSGL